jgi:zeaxanthin glucosyltransferase
LPKQKNQFGKNNTMARIIFMIDIEEGHLFPSFALARSLQQAGHELLYVSIADNEGFIRAAGFSFYPLFEHRYPKGYRETYKQKKKQKGLHQLVSVTDHIEDFLSPEFGSFLKGLDADLLVMSSFLQVEALMLYYKTRLRPVLLRPYLREPGATITGDCIRHLMHLPAETTLRLFDLAASLGYQFTSLAELVQPLARFYELVICPKAFELDGEGDGSFTHYIGSGIDVRRYAGPIPFLQPGRKIIYASLGSQAIAYRQLFELFFTRLTALMGRSAFQQMQLVIAIGPEAEDEKYTSVLPNVRVVKWISQMDVLREAALAIVHGGLGTVKECIYHAVPMVVMPVTHDQPSNARRVAHHGLGVSLDIAAVTVEELENAVLALLTGGGVREALAAMQQRFRQADEENLGVKIIEKLLPQENIVI